MPCISITDLRIVKTNVETHDTCQNLPATPGPSYLHALITL